MIKGFTYSHYLVIYVLNLLMEPVASVSYPVLHNTGGCFTQYHRVSCCFFQHPLEQGLLHTIGHVTLGYSLPDLSRA